MPIVGVILVLAFYPQFGLRRSEPSVRSSIAAAELQQHHAYEAAPGGDPTP